MRHNFTESGTNYVDFQYIHFTKNFADSWNEDPSSGHV